MRAYVVNQLIQWEDDGPTERVLWLHPGGEGMFAIDIFEPKALPIFRNAASIEAHERSGAVHVLDKDPWFRAVDEASLPQNQKNIRDRAWQIIRPIIFDQPAVFDADSRGALVRRAMAEHSVTNQTIYRMLRRYWQRGMAPNALLPDFDKCGAPGNERAVTGKKRGRPRLYGPSAGINVDQSVRKLFRDVVTRHYAENNKLDLGGAYRALIRWHYSTVELDDRTGQQLLVPVADCPTEMQFRYWLQKDNDLFALERRRRTPRVYDKDMRALMSSSSSEVFGPGARYQIDATIADIFLVSRYDRNRIIGRPVLYVVIDVYSRMIVGIYVGLEGPSWVGAMMALANTVADKVQFCRQFNMVIDSADWPCQALPSVLLGDKGELAGEKVETLIRALHVHVENAAPYRADWKGIVEQRFRLLQAEFKPYLPGYIDGDYRIRGGEDYRLDGTLDIDQFTRAIILCVLHHNNAHYYRKFEREADMVADDVKAIPVEMWEWGIKHRSGRLHTFPEEMVKLSLLPADEATVTPSGIKFYGCYYSCRKALEEHWFEKARQKRGWKVRISYEPRCMDEIYIHGARGEFVTCALTDLSAEFRGKTLWEIDQIRRISRRMGAEHQPTEIMSRINLAQNFDAIVAEAEAMKADGPPPPASKRERVGNIRENRAAEKAANRPKEAFRLGGELPAKGGEVVRFPGGDEDDYSLPEVADYLLDVGKEPSDDR
ncbi:MAG: Mu transposase C-terminal domain-containing protein [Candidatus Zixiibacteriota bacterium]